MPDPPCEQPVGNRDGKAEATQDGPPGRRKDVVVLDRGGMSQLLSNAPPEASPRYP